MSIMQENQMIYHPKTVNKKTTVQNIENNHAKSKCHMKLPISKIGRKEDYYLLTTIF